MVKELTRKMKDSGIEWIGEIPEDWEITKLKNVLFDKVEKNDSDNPIVLSLARAGIKVRDISNNEGQLAESYLNYNKVSYGDLLLNPMDLISGANCNISEVEGVISPAYFNLNPIDNNNIYYYGYYFKLQYWNMVLFAHGKGVSFENRWTLNRETLLNYYLPVPPISKQKAITNFLDKKTQEIDNIISKTKKAIEEYKKYKQSLITETVTKGLDENVQMKDSGIEWIGEIPEHWDVRKLKNISLAFGSGTTPTTSNDKYYGGNISWIQSGDLYNRNVIQETSKCITETAVRDISTLKVYEKPFIVVAMYGASVGNTCISNINACVNQACCIIKPIGDLYYYYYCILTAKDYLLSTTSGGSQPNISQEKLKNLYIPRPNKWEQEQIAAYLDQKCTQIDQIISTKENLLAEMEAYKKSLIYETVTGKREVE